MCAPAAASGQAPSLSGPERLTLREQIEIIGDVIGRPLSVTEQTEAESAEMLSRHVPEVWVRQIIKDWREAVGACPRCPTSTRASPASRLVRSADGSKTTSTCSKGRTADAADDWVVRMPQRLYPPTGLISARVPGADDIVLVDDDRLLVVVSIRAFPEGLEARLMACSAPGIDLRDRLLVSPNTPRGDRVPTLALNETAQAEPFTTISGGGGEHKCDLLLYTAVPADVTVDAIVFRWPEFGLHAEFTLDAGAVADARTRVHTPRWV